MIYIYICVCVCVCTYINMYIYILDCTRGLRPREVSNEFVGMCMFVMSTFGTDFKCDFGNDFDGVMGMLYQMKRS